MTPQKVPKDAKAAVDSPQQKVVDPRQRMVWLFLIAGQVFVAAAILLATLSARRWAIEHFSSEESLQQWQAWQSETERLAEPSATPVKRRPIEHQQPPTLALLDRYLGTTIVGLLGFSSLLYWIIAGMLIGVSKRIKGTQTD